ncbi:hypothetical protein CUMW_097850, partial [Citrus unshiu]
MYRYVPFQNPIRFDSSRISLQGLEGFCFGIPLVDFEVRRHAMFVRAEKNVNELNLSGELMKKESKRLLERAALAEKDMIRGETELQDVCVVYISIVQAYNYHVTVFQWHPEKNTFEWGPKAIPH